MADDLEKEESDTLRVEGEPKSSARILAAIKKAERAMNAWQALCDRIDEIYSAEGREETEWRDPDYDLFWASMEVMKPAVYARPPQPVVSPQFKDRRPLPNVTAELLERSIASAFDRGGIDEAMYCARDDLLLYGRGQMWVTLEDGDDGRRLCFDHVDRKDFLHPPARKWSEVPWVARRAWLTRSEARKRFHSHSRDAYMNATVSSGEGTEKEHKGKIAVWEVWHKADRRVYWVAEGVNVMLDEGEPHLKLRGFFPCPRPAFGTLRPRTLVPVPDYVRYSGHFRKINQLTRRIYDLLDAVRMKGLIPAGGDVSEAVEQLVREDDSSMMLIPVPSAALVAGSSSGFVTWLPLGELAQAIAGLIEARRELFSDFDRLSGISDIMRGETEAEETLGAQQLKSQYGSVRVREKIDELQRLARDVTAISAEIMAENFGKDALLEMSRMEVPTKADIDRRVKETEKAAADELKGLKEKARTAPQQEPAQTAQMFDPSQQQIVSRYAAVLKRLGETVPIEDVMKLLRDDRARGFAFEIATDSTILTDELQEKASRNEFLTPFMGAANGLATLAGLAEPGAKLAGEMLKFVLQPYRVGREMNGVIDEFIDAAPQMAQMAAGQGKDDGLAEANAKIAEAELGRAQAAIKKVEADAALKAFELQQRQQEAMASAQRDSKRFELEIADTQGKLRETDARIQKIAADIELAFAKLGIEQHREQREDIKVASDIQGQQQDRAMQAREADREAAFRARESLAERQAAKEQA